MMFYQKGLTLLEFLFVMAIACVIGVLGYRSVEQYQQSEKIARLQYGVLQLMDALNQYYYVNCEPSEVDNLTVQQLQQDGYLTNDVMNPWGNFEVQIKNNNLSVTAVFLHDHVLVPWVSAAMNGTVGDEIKMLNAIKWIRSPRYSTADVMMYPGRQVTALNKGMASTLWILNSELQVFDKQESKTTCSP